jgi:Flp pilus assembly protein TadG
MPHPRLRFRPRQRQRQRGAIAIMVALSMMVLLTVVGLVIDGGAAYLVKARLNAAVDSAALAGARAVTNGSTQAAQTASAQAAAATYFAANIPSNYMLSTPQLLSTTVTFNAGTATIDVRAKAPMPVSLMRLLGFTSLTPAAYAQTIRRDLDMAFVVDTSGSLSGSGTAVRSAATTFLNQFNVTQDRVALIHFATGAEVDNPIATTARGFNRTSMLSNVAAFNFSGATSSVEGMWHARDQLNSIATANRSSMRVIVFFSDGEPTSFGTSLTFNNANDCTSLGNPVVGIVNSSGQGLFRPDVSEYSYFSNSSCLFNYRNGGYIEIWDAVKKLPDWYNAHNPSLKEFPIVTNTPRVVTNDVSSPDIAKRNLDRAGRNLAEAVAAKARSEGIVVMTLGLGADLKIPTGVDNEVGENILKCMANVADGPSRCYNPNQPVGMYCYAATTSDLTPCFSRLASAILRISK